MKKLRLNKQMIAQLGNQEMSRVQGGTEITTITTTDVPTAWCYTLPTTESNLGDCYTLGVTVCCGATIDCATTYETLECPTTVGQV